MHRKKACELMMWVISSINITIYSIINNISEIFSELAHIITSKRTINCMILA